MAKGKFKFKKWMVVGLIAVGLLFVLWPMLKGNPVLENIQQKIVSPPGAKWW